jgi:hypothetical protein
MQRFFTCLECRQHFGAAIDKEAGEMAGWDKQKAAMWLWRTHNYVNNRSVHCRIPPICFQGLQLTMGKRVEGC